MNRDGTNRRRLFVADEFRGIAWSPDGRSIALAARVEGSGFDVWIVNVKTGRAASIASGADYETNPVWSPDGSRVAYEQEYRSDDAYGAWLMVYSVASGEAVRVTPDNTGRTGPHAAQPAWSPDGTRLAYAEFNAYEDGLNFGYFNIATVGTDGSGVHVLTHNTKRDCQNPTWGPVANRILFDRGQYPDESGSGFSEAIVSIKPDGRDRVALIKTGERLVGWSPDGEWVLGIRPGYNGDFPTHAPGIYAMRRDGTGLRRVVPGPLFAGADWQAK